MRILAYFIIIFSLFRLSALAQSGPQSEAEALQNPPSYQLLKKLKVTSMDLEPDGRYMTRAQMEANAFREAALYRGKNLKMTVIELYFIVPWETWTFIPHYREVPVPGMEGDAHSPQGFIIVNSTMRPNGNFFTSFETRFSTENPYLRLREKMIDHEIALEKGSEPEAAATWIPSLTSPPPLAQEPESVEIKRKRPAPVRKDKDNEQDKGTRKKPLIPAKISSTVSKSHVFGKPPESRFAVLIDSSGSILSDANYFSTYRDIAIFNLIQVVRASSPEQTIIFGWACRGELRELRGGDTRASAIIKDYFTRFGNVHCEENFDQGAEALRGKNIERLIIYTDAYVHDTANVARKLVAEARREGYSITLALIPNQKYPPMPAFVNEIITKTQGELLPVMHLSVLDETQEKVKGFLKDLIKL